MQIIKDILRPAPQVLYLEPFFGCNYRCFCCIHGSDRQIRPAQFGLPLFEKVKPLISRVRHVHMTGLGEPLLNSRLLHYLEYLRDHDKSYYINTNGSLIDEAFIDLVTTSRCELSVSLDAGNMETYEKVRHPTYWPKIMEALKRLAEVRADRKTGFPLTYVTFHIDAMNLLSMVHVPELCRELRVDAVKLSWTSLPRQYEDYSLFGDQDVVTEILHAVTARLQRKGIHVKHEAGFGKHSRGCWALSPMVFVGATGNVAACCSRWITVGSLLENSIEDIWNGMPRRRICLGVLNKKPEESCRDCAQIRGADYSSNPEDFLKPDGSDEAIQAEKTAKPERLPCLDGLDSEFRSGIEALLAADFEIAVNVFSSLDERFPDYFEIKNNLAVAYHYSGNSEKSREILSQAKEIPHNERLIQANLEAVLKK